MRSAYDLTSHFTIVAHKPKLEELQIFRNGYIAFCETQEKHTSIQVANLGLPDVIW